MLGLVMVLAVLVAVPESLPPQRRHGGGLRAFAVAGRHVLAQRRYVGYVLVSGSGMGAVFAYVATSAFVLQSMNADVADGVLDRLRRQRRVATRAVILSGPVAALVAGMAMLVGALWFDTPLELAVVCFFVLMTAQA